MLIELSRRYSGKEGVLGTYLFLIIFVPTVNRGEVNEFLEQDPKRLIIGISHTIYGFDNGFAADFNVLFDSFNFHPLNVFVQVLMGTKIATCFIR